jgi:hypothetical protein
MPPHTVAEIRAHLEKIRTEDVNRKKIAKQQETALMVKIERAEARDKRLAKYAARWQEQRKPPLPALITSQTVFVSFTLISTNRNEDMIQAHSWVALDDSSDEDYVPSETEAVLLTKRKKKEEIQTQPTILEGDERCAGCIEKDIPCLLNTDLIHKWEKEVEEGGRPTGVRCEECRTKKSGCHLPRKKVWAKNDTWGGADNKVGPQQRLKAYAEQVKEPFVNMPAWAAHLEGLSTGVHIELERNLNAHVRSSLAEERIAIALNKLANRFVQNGSYLPHIVSLAQSRFDGVGGSDNEEPEQ